MIGTGMTGTAGAGTIATTAAIGMTGMMIAATAMIVTTMAAGTAAVAEVRHRLGFAPESRKVLRRFCLVGRNVTQPIAVRVDQPFVFAIQHWPSGACLFVGRMNDPR